MNIEKETLKKIGTLGGSLKFNKNNSWMYLGGGSNKNLVKEKLFGKAGKGSLHIGMPYQQELAIEAVQSDTKQTLIRELTEQTHMTRREAEEAVTALLKKGIMKEVDDPNLGKVLIFKGG